MNGSTEGMGLGLFYDFTHGGITGGIAVTPAPVQPYQPEGWLRGHVYGALVIAGAVAWFVLGKRDVGIALVAVGVGLIVMEKTQPTAPAMQTFGLPATTPAVGQLQLSIG